MWLRKACEDGSCAPDASAASDQSGHYPLVYAIGNVEIRFPSLGIEKEFVQATGRADTAGLTDQQTLQTVLAQPQNRYLSRQVCWVFTIEGLEHYLLWPREPNDYDLLLEAVRANPSRQDVDVVVGFVNNVPVPEEQDEGRFCAAVGEVFDRFLKVVDNAGATDDHRALNYLATRYPAVYNLSAERFSAGFSLMAIETAPSRLSSTRRLINVNFAFANRETQLPDRYSVRVDVTEEFPFLASTLTPAPFIAR